MSGRTNRPTLSLPKGVASILSVSYLIFWIGRYFFVSYPHDYEFFMPSWLASLLSGFVVFVITQRLGAVSILLRELKARSWSPIRLAIFVACLAVYFFYFTVQFANGLRLHVYEPGMADQIAGLSLLGSFMAIMAMSLVTLIAWVLCVVISGAWNVDNDH